MAEAAPSFYLPKALPPCVLFAARRETPVFAPQSAARAAFDARPLDSYYTWALFFNICAISRAEESFQL